MMRGEAPFDAHKVEATFAQCRDGGRRCRPVPRQFQDRRRNPRLAEDLGAQEADFDAKAAEFGKVDAENRARSRTSLDSFKADFPRSEKLAAPATRPIALAKQLSAALPARSTAATDARGVFACGTFELRRRARLDGSRNT